MSDFVRPGVGMSAQHSSPPSDTRVATRDDPNVTRVSVKPDVFAWLTASASSVNEASPEICGWCGLLVRWAVPDEDERHAWGGCVGRERPKDYEPIARRGRVAVFTVQWQDDLTGDDIRRCARVWAAKISERPAVKSVHVNTYGTVARGEGAS